MGASSAASRPGGPYAQAKTGWQNSGPDCPEWPAPAGDLQAQADAHRAAARERLAAAYELAYQARRVAEAMHPGGGITAPVEETSAIFMAGWAAGAEATLAAFSQPPAAAAPPAGRERRWLRAVPGNGG